MKTKSRNLLIVFLMALAMIFIGFALTPLTANAAAYPPDPTKIPAGTIYVGGVELGLGQYVKNGETTATTGEPAEDATGFAWYTEGGTLVLVDYTYQGKGYEYSSGNYALIYSTGTLYVAGGGVNTLNQTQSGNMGIYSVGALTITPTGTLTVESNNGSCLYSNNEITFNRYLGTVNLKSTGNAFAIVSYDNDGDSLTEQGIIVNGGDIYVETFYPISNLTINYGALKVSSPQYSLSQVPDISNYDGGYTLTVSENEDGSNSTIYNQDTITTFDPDTITDYKYLRLAPPAKTVINNVSVSALDLPEIGESFVYPDETALTYGGEYIVSGCWIEKYTGTEWIYLEDAEVIEYSVKYRYVLTLRPNAGYTFSEDLTDNDVMINGQEGAVLMTFPDDAFTTMVEVALEFSYQAPATDYGITIADMDESGATVGVLITEENCTDVLGDDTVSYEPTTNTLTLNNYVYNGEGAEDEDIGYYGYGLMADLPVEGLTIVLVGENSIKLSGSDSVGMALFGNSDLTIKGDGSLTINTGMQGIVMAQNSSTIKIEGGNIDITTTAIAVSTKNFVMTGGNLKITTNMFGFATLSADGAFCINGGSVEISTAYVGYAFIYADIEHETYNPIAPDLSGYVGAYKMTASVNADGSDATDFNESYLSSYKYVKIIEIENYGITIADKDESGATVGVLITEENYTDVLGDGTVSYNPTTKTLTLNGYKYEGSGFEHDSTKFGIFAPKSIGTLNIVLKGENLIDVTKEDTLARVRIPSTGVYTYETDVVFSGDGSLVISATDGGLSIFGEDAPSLEIKGGNITVNAFYSIETKYFKMSGGSLTVNATEGDIASAIYSYEFKMTGGNLKITSAGLGVEMWHDSDEDEPPMISGGTFDISVAIAGGAFCYYDYDENVCVALAPNLTNYVGAYKFTADVNADGTGATDYNVSNIATYKYAKLEPTHVHDYGTAWESDASEHWNECACGDKTNKAAHNDGNADGKCDVCAYTISGSSSSSSSLSSNSQSNGSSSATSVESSVSSGGSSSTIETSTSVQNSTSGQTSAVVSTSVTTSTSTSASGGGLSGGAIAGIAIGSVAVLGVGGFSIFWFVIKKKSFADLISIFKKNK